MDGFTHIIYRHEQFCLGTAKSFKQIMALVEGYIVIISVTDVLVVLETSRVYVYTKPHFLHVVHHITATGAHTAKFHSLRIRMKGLTRELWLETQ